MEGKIALEEHFLTELNNRYWNARGEEDRHGRDYAQDVAGRWFNDLRLDNAAKLQIDRGNAARLFSLDLPALPERAAAGFAA